MVESDDGAARRLYKQWVPWSDFFEGHATALLGVGCLLLSKSDRVIRCVYRPGDVPQRARTPAYFLQAWRQVRQSADKESPSSSGAAARDRGVGSAHAGAAAPSRGRGLPCQSGASSLHDSRVRVVPERPRSIPASTPSRLAALRTTAAARPRARGDTTGWPTKAAGVEGKKTARRRVDARRPRLRKRYRTRTPYAAPGRGRPCPEGHRAVAPLSDQDCTSGRSRKTSPSSAGSIPGPATICVTG